VCRERSPKPGFVAFNVNYSLAAWWRPLSAFQSSCTNSGLRFESRRAPSAARSLTLRRNGCNCGPFAVGSCPHRQRPAAVLDVGMPRMTGLQAAALTQQHQDVKVLMLSMYDSEQRL
jgi:CheY-like chemotaxis protein